MPTLSICVPTYNRSSLLRQNLASIGGQVTAAAAGDVELIVSDNASADDTTQAVSDFAAAHPQLPLTYVRQTANLGAEGNLCELLQRASGEYVLFLSDDDLLLPGAIDKVLEVAQLRPGIGAIGLNARPFLEAPSEGSAPVLPLTQDRLLADKDDTLTTLGTWLTFVSVLAFRTSGLDRQGYRQRIGTNFVHAYVFLDVLAQGRGTWLSAEALVAIRGNNTGGYDFFQTFVSNFAALLEHAIDLGFSAAAVRRVLKDHQRFIWNLVLVFKVRGGYGTLRPDPWDGLKQVWRVYKRDPLFLLQITLLLLAPSPLFRLARGARRRLRRPAA